MPTYSAAMKAVKADDWSQVIVRMNAYVARDPNNADALERARPCLSQDSATSDNAFKNYDKALKIDPKHRECARVPRRGVPAGRRPRAGPRPSCRSLDRLCFLPCEQYTDLKDEIARYKSEHPPVATR